MGIRFTSSLFTCEAHHLIKSPFESKSVFTDYLTKVVLKLNRNKKKNPVAFIQNLCNKALTLCRE